jgi:aspartokinase-like uncharacterized kinase
VKVGGSLLTLGDFVSSLRRWLVGLAPGGTVLVVGGGPWADAVRRMDRRRKLGEHAAHWLCIRAMSVASRRTAARLPELTWTDQFDRFVGANGRGTIAGGPVIFDPDRFLRTIEPALPGRPLPWGWHVTSDSIAARIAEVMRVDELVLLKSALPPAAATLDDLAAAGYVDRYFPQAARPLGGIGCVNLRAPQRPERWWRRQTGSHVQPAAQPRGRTRLS